MVEAITINDVAERVSQQVSGTFQEQFEKLLEEVKKNGGASVIAQQSEDKTVNPLTAWVNSLDEQPGAGTVIDVQDDGGFRVLQKAEMGIEFAEMGAPLSFIERPLNSFLPNLPVGSVLVGGTIGLVVAEVLEGIAEGFSKNGDNGEIAGIGSAIVGNMAALALLWVAGEQVMSKRANTFAMAIPLVRIVSDLVPLDDFIAKVVDFFKDFGDKQARNPRGTVADAEKFLRAARHGQNTPIVGHPSDDTIRNIF